MTTHILSHTLNDDPAYKVVHDEFTTSAIRIARQILVPTSTAEQVLVATPALGLLVKQTHLRCPIRRKTLTARGIIYIPPWQPCYVIISCFLQNAQHLPKVMVVACTENAPLFIYHCQKSLPDAILIGSPEEGVSRAPSRKSNLQTPVISSDPSTTKPP